MKEFILEANFTEFRNRYERGKPFAIISAFQGGVDVSQNKKYNVELRKKIIEQGYQVIKIMGRYQESDSYYENMIVFCDDVTRYKDFVRFLIFFGKHYYQNSVIIVDADSNIWEYATRQNSTVGVIGTKRRYDKFLNMSNNEVENLIRMFTQRTYELEYVRIVTD